MSQSKKQPQRNQPKRSQPRPHVVERPEPLARDFVEANHLWLKPGGNVLDGDLTLRHWRGQFYTWQQGLYRPISEGDLKKLVVQHLHQVNEDRRYEGIDPISVTVNLVRNILLNLESLYGVHVSEQIEPESWLHSEGPRNVLNCRNGLLYPGLLKHGRKGLSEHDPAFFGLSQIPYDYDADANNAPWERFLFDVFDDDVELYELLAQFAGYILMPGMQYHKFLMLIGDGANGKSVIKSVLERMVGVDNVSNVPLEEFGDRFGLAATIGKKLNTTGEASDSLTRRCEEQLKAFVAGERMKFECKYGQAFSGVPTTKLLIATNDPPRFLDRSLGLWRRLLVIPFEKTYREDQQDRDLTDKLCTDMPGILNWALMGMEALQSRGGFVIPRRTRHAMERYQTISNPARAFLEERYALCFTGRTPCSEVYQAYRSWCGENGFSPINSANFGKEVKRTFPDSENKRVREGGIRNRVYENIVSSAS